MYEVRLQHRIITILFLSFFPPGNVKTIAKCIATQIRKPHVKLLVPSNSTGYLLRNAKSI